MSESRRCPQCGAQLSIDAPEGLCPECLVKQALKSQGDSAGSQESGATGPYQSRPVPPEAEDIAKHFPQLEIIDLLGQGGMGVVYKGKQPSLDRPVALKILPAEAAREPGFPERFTREARALAKLTHPGIVAVYDFGQQGGLYYLLMEFVDGMNLRQLLRQGKLNPAEALKIVPQICEALQYAHDEGIVHRDIKPENILLDKRGRVKIADFGLAKLLGQMPADSALTGSRQVMGTLHYMAPEQLEKSLTVDHRADIYSLGVVFYEMLTGELPLGRFAPPSRKVQVDVRLDEVVLRALEKEPEQRYQHIGEVKTEVETIAFTASQPQATAPPRDQPQLVAGMDADQLERLLLPLLPDKAGDAIKLVQERGATDWEALTAVVALARKHDIRLPRLPLPWRSLILYVLPLFGGVIAADYLIRIVVHPSLVGLSLVVTVPLGALALVGSLYINFYLTKYAWRVRAPMLGRLAYWTAQGILLYGIWYPLWSFFVSPEPALNRMYDAIGVNPGAHDVLFLRVLEIGGLLAMVIWFFVSFRRFHLQNKLNAERQKQQANAITSEGQPQPFKASKANGL